MEEEDKKSDSNTLVVVRCDTSIAWLHAVPLDWRVVLSGMIPTCMSIQRCAITLSITDLPMKVLRNAMGISVKAFMHDDGLRPYSGQPICTPIEAVEPIVSTTKQFVTKDHPFLHFGVEVHIDR